MSTLIKNLVSLIVIAAVLFFGGWYVTRSAPAADEGESRIGVSSSMASSSNNLADEFAALLKQLDGVDFQGSSNIFNNQIFKDGLLSFRRDLPQIDKSRTNPFAPVEGNPASYVHYLSPLPASLRPSASSTASTTAGFPSGARGTSTGVKATGTRR